jgi:hypothetical protein
MQPHYVNLKKIVDDLTQYIENVAYNSDSELTLTQSREIQRYSYIEPGSVNYNTHITYESLADTQTYSGLT